MQNEKFMLSDLPDYFVPDEGDLKFYKEVSNCCQLVVGNYYDHGFFCAVRSRNATV